MQALLSFGLFMCLIGCKTKRLTSTEFPNSICEVNLEELVEKIGSYHGMTIQTTGLFSVGFEESSLSPAKIVLSQDNNFKFEIKSIPGIWIDPDIQFVPFDSIHIYTHKTTGRLTTIQGIVDTTRTGHMQWYVGTITKARFVVSR
jgi:hypothetical protein